MVNASAEQANPSHRLKMIDWAFGIMGIAFVVFFVQAINYKSIFGWLAEWQFAHLGRYFPSLTMILCVAVVAIIAFAALWLLRRLRQGRRTEAETTEAASPFARERGFQQVSRLFLIASACAALFALGNFFHFIQLPDNKGARQLLDMGSQEAKSVAQGPVTAKSLRIVGPIGHYSDDLIFYRRTTYVAPIAMTVNAEREKRLTAFVELTADEVYRRAFPETRDGILRKDGLPPEVAMMYRGAGYGVDGDSPVIFRTVASLERSTVILMLEFLTLSLLTLLIGLFARSRYRRLKKDRLEQERKPG